MRVLLPHEGSVAQVDAELDCQRCVPGNWLPGLNQMLGMCKTAQLTSFYSLVTCLNEALVRTVGMGGEKMEE